MHWRASGGRGIGLVAVAVAAAAAATNCDTASRRIMLVDHPHSRPTDQPTLGHSLTECDGADGLEVNRALLRHDDRVLSANQSGEGLRRAVPGGGHGRKRGVRGGRVCLDRPRDLEDFRVPLRAL